MDTLDQQSSYQQSSASDATTPVSDGGSARRRALVFGSVVGVVLCLARAPSVRQGTAIAFSLPSKNSAYGPMKYRKSEGKYPPSGVYGDLLGDDQIQKNWPGLTCERSDDDKWEWGLSWFNGTQVQNDMGGTDCLRGDTGYCMSMMQNPSWRKSNIAWNLCNSTCNYTDIDILENSYNSSNTTQNTVKLSGTSYLAVCEWEAIKKMPETCNHDFVPKLPTNASNNLGPSVEDRNATNIYINGTYQYPSCNIHALCYVCVDEDESINKYCEAIMYHYSMNDRTQGAKHSLASATTLFWDNTPYWCQSEVLEAIGTGHYKEKLAAGLLGPWNPKAKGGNPWSDDTKLTWQTEHDTSVDDVDIV